jgi:hypothetical protein
VTAGSGLTGGGVQGDDHIGSGQSGHTARRCWRMMPSPAAKSMMGRFCIKTCLSRFRTATVSARRMEVPRSGLCRQ